MFADLSPLERRRVAAARVALVVAEDWACTLLAAELRERGLLAGGARRLAAVLLLPQYQCASPIRVVVGERENVDEHDVAVLRWCRAVCGRPASILIAAAGAELEPGPWDRVLRRPVTLAAVADAVQAAAAVSGYPPVEMARGPVEVRLGSPWPTAWCSGCGQSRHAHAPRDAAGEQLVRTAMVQFGLEHEHHGGGSIDASCA